MTVTTIAVHNREPRSKLSESVERFMTFIPERAQILFGRERLSILMRFLYGAALNSPIVYVAPGYGKGVYCLQEKERCVDSNLFMHEFFLQRGHVDAFSMRDVPIVTHYMAFCELLGTNKIVLTDDMILGAFADLFIVPTHDNLYVTKEESFGRLDLHEKLRLVKQGFTAQDVGFRFNLTSNDILLQEGRKINDQLARSIEELGVYYGVSK